MADGKLTYDIDFNVNTEAISRAIARAVDQATSARVHAIDQAVMGLAERKHPDIYEEARDVHLGLDSVVGEGATIADFAAMAAANPYRYQPSTIQTMIRNAANKAAAQHEADIDLRYKLDMEAATGELRRNQRQLRAAELANIYLNQGNLFAAAAAQAQTPEAQRILLGRSAGRFGAIASRTIMEAGGVDDEAAAAALATSADISAARAGIKTTAQLQHESDRATSTWLRNEIKSGNKAVAMWAAARGDKEAQYDLMERSLVTKEAQEDAAWTAREKELGYSPSQKAREMEAGFRAMEAMSATEDLYNAGGDPAALRSSIGDSIKSAQRYANMATTFDSGSDERDVYARMARSAISGITANSLAKAGFTGDEIKQLITAIVRVTKVLEGLDGGGKEPEDSGVNASDVGSQIGKFMATTGAIAKDFMAGRTRWLADTKTPYSTRRDVRQDWAIKYGQEAIIPGAIGGAAIGNAIVPGVGAVVGGIVGGGAGLVTTLVGQHNKDEKAISDSFQQKAIGWQKLKYLYGDNVDYNYMQWADNTGLVSSDSLVQMKQTANMIPGAMAFGAVGEEQMMALSMMPRYWNALMNNASPMELAEAYRQDIEEKPGMYRQYITSILPGLSEEVRAFVGSQTYRENILNGGIGMESSAMDVAQSRYLSSLEGTRAELSNRDLRSANEYWSDELDKMDEPNLFRRPEARRVIKTKPRYIGFTPMDEYYYSSPTYDKQFHLYNGEITMADMMDKNKPIGVLVVQLDGVTVYQQEYSMRDFEQSNMSYAIGGAI